VKTLGKYRFAGGCAVVTGAASGIGEHLAHGLAARGSDMVLLDRDTDRLTTVAMNIRAAHPGVAVSTIVVDLVDQAAIKAAAQQILREQSRITLLINNAGVALGGRFERLTLDEFDWVMSINFRAPVVLTHHLLPTLINAPGSHLVNVSSVFGLIGPGGQSAYCASKFALRGFSEVLRAELAQHRVGVTTVHPGGIRTRIAETARTAAAVSAHEIEAGRQAISRMLTYPADKAAARILDGVEKRRGRVLIAWTAAVPDLLVRLMPGSYTRILLWLDSAARPHAEASTRDTTASAPPSAGTATPGGEESIA
jgi:short-subunit dehydrogenase